MPFLEYPHKLLILMNFGAISACALVASRRLSVAAIRRNCGPLPVSQMFVTCHACPERGHIAGKFSCRCPTLIDLP
jgi:hypothetical protein